MAPQYVFTMKGLGKTHPPDTVVLKDIWLSFLPGAKIGVLGANGAGKSTLLKIMAGLDPHFGGEAFPGEGVSIGYLAQEPTLNPDKDVKGNVEEGVASIRALLNRYDALNMKLAEDLSPEEMDQVLDEQSRLQDKIDASNAWDLDSRLEMAMDSLRLPPADAVVSTLSGGERRRVALCRLLLQSPDLLLLDEPTNHLDAESVAWLERFLKDYPGTVVAVTHDRYFLDNVAGWILELDRSTGIPYEGNYTGWLEQKKARLATEEKVESKRQLTLQRELDWIRMSPRARQAKGKARLNAYEQLLAEDTAQKIDTVEIYIPPGPRLGDIVVEARGLRKAYGDLVLFDDLTFTLPRGGIVGVIGPNGAGKTTTFRLITGAEKPDGGSLRLGETVQIGYVDQSRDALNANKTVWEEISGGEDEIMMGKRTVPSRAYVSWFNFKGATQQRKVGALSGGERNRLHLAKLLRMGCNLLLLDEPTNDLDVDTLRALEEALLNFAGCAVVISHNRWFLDRIATHILAFEGDSEATWFSGNYQDYEADRKRRLGAEADQPHRIKYKKTHERVNQRKGKKQVFVDELEGSHMNADQAKAVAETVGQQLQQEWMTTYKVLSAVPEGKRDYKPEVNSRSAWELATHIAGADVWFLDGVLNGKFDTPSDKAPAPTVTGVADWYKKEFPNRLERVLALDGSKLTQIVDFYGMKMPAVQYLLFTLVHMVHHRGQLATYLRPMGGKCPSIYGGSFDEQWQAPQDAKT